MASPQPTLYFAYGSNLSPTQMAARCPQSRLIGVAQLIGYTWLINARGYANVVDISRLRGPGAPRNEPNVVLSMPKSTSGPNGEPEPSGPVSNDVKETVYGLLYALPPEDEARLDRAEGVPSCYGKEWLPVRFWPLDANAQLANAASTDRIKALGDIVDPYLPSGAAGGTASAKNEDARNQLPQPQNSKAPPSPAPRPRDVSSQAAIPLGRAHIEGRGETRRALVYVDRERITPSTIQPEYIRRMQRGVAEAEERGVPARWMENVIVPWLGAK